MGLDIEDDNAFHIDADIEAFESSFRRAAKPRLFTMGDITVSEVDAVGAFRVGEG